jgi:hypothetical protein
MNPHMLNELAFIAQAEELPMFQALDKLANSMMGYGGANTAGAKMMPPPNVQPSPTGMKGMGSPGATAMAGMSVHCDKCFCEIKEKDPKFCPKCGHRIKGIRDIKSPPKGRRVPENEISSNRGDQAYADMGGPTGGEAAVNEELAEGRYADTGKYAGAKKKALNPLLQKLKGSLSIGGGLYAGVEGAKALSGAGQQQGKYAGIGFKRGSRLAAFNLKPKAGRHATVEDGLTRIKRATRKNTQRILARA